MIKISHHGDFAKTQKFLTKAKNLNYRPILERYASQGTAALQSATPMDTGLTAQSWSHEIVITRRGLSIFWKNTHLEGGLPIVILLQYGHATRTGGFVEGRDFINPAMKPIFDTIAQNLWKEVTSL